MKDYEMIFWCIQEQKESPFATDNYFPLMKRIMINNGYNNADFMKDTTLSYLNHIIRTTCQDMNNLNLYYHQTLLVCATFNELFKKDKEKAMHLKTEDFLNILRSNS